MPIFLEPLGKTLINVALWPPGSVLFLPRGERYEANTRCYIAWTEGAASHGEEEAHRRACFKRGYDGWLDVGVVSDALLGAADWTVPLVIAQFNQECQEGQRLARMWNKVLAGVRGL
jgi:hypothetical protein